MRYIVWTFLLMACQVQAQEAEKLLKKSLAFHDPEQQWASAMAKVSLEETRPGATTRHTTLWIDNAQNKWRIEREQEAYEVQGTQVRRIKGNRDRERGLTLRDYYQYLYGLPMKIEQSSHRLSSQVSRKELKGIRYYVLEVDYPKDTWYFYLHPKTYALEAYKYIKKSGTGEVIYLNGLISIGAMKLPKQRSWYTLEGEYLGKDTIVKVE